MGIVWFRDVPARKPNPTSTSPELIYKLNGATQRSYTDPFGTMSPPIPIGPHWMILRNFDAKAESCRSSTIMGDAGNHGDIRRNPNAHLTDLRLTWEGNEYRRDDRGVWTMKYERS